MIIGIEIAAERRHPLEAPAHAFLELFDLGQRRAGDDDERNIALRQMHDAAVEMAGEIRAARAAGFPARTEHKVIDDQLALAAEQVGQGFLAVRTIEYIMLVDPLP